MARHGSSLVDGVLFGLVATVSGGVATLLFGSSFSCGPFTDTMVTKVAQTIEVRLLRGIELHHNRMDKVFPDGVPHDDFGHPLHLIVPGPNGLDFDVVSYGEDYRPGGTSLDRDIRYSDSLNPPR